MCSYFEWRLNAELSALKEFESTVWKDFKRPGPYPAHYTLPAPSLRPFAHPKLRTSNIPTAIPSFGPRAPLSPPSATSLILSENPRSSHRSSTTPPQRMYHSFPFECTIPANSMSPATPPNYYVHLQESSPIPVRPKARTSIVTKDTPPKKTSSTDQH